MKTPNDPKLSDGRGWRDRCVAGERRRQEAAGVTAAPVRCSAWLGDVDCGADSGILGFIYGLVQAFANSLGSLRIMRHRLNAHLKDELLSGDVKASSGTLWIS